MAGVLFTGGLCWFMIDASKQIKLEPDTPVVQLSSPVGGI